MTTMDSTQAPTMDVGHYLSVLRRRWVTVVVIVVVGLVAVAGYLAVAPKTYQAKATVAVQAITSNPFDSNARPDQQINIDTEAKVASSGAVADLAAKQLKPSPDPELLRESLAVTPVVGTTTMTFAVTNSSARAAADDVNALARAYLSYRSQLAAAQQQTQLTSIAAQLAGLTSELTILQGIIATNDPTSAVAKNAESRIAIVNQQVGALASTRSSLSTMSIVPGQLVSAAQVPTAPISPSKKMYLAAGLLVALILGIVGAFVREAMDRRVRGADDFGRSGAGALLATVRADHGPASEGGPLRRPDDPRAQDIRELRGRLLAELEPGGKSLAVLPAGPSTASLGPDLAASLATSGRNVTLILPGLDQDQAATMSERLGLTVDAHGLPAVLAGEDHEVPVPVTAAAPTLRVLAGAVSDDVLAGDELVALIRELSQRGDLVLVDPGDRVAPSRLADLIRVCDSVVLVAVRSRSRRRALRQLAALVAPSRTRLLGGVLLAARRRERVRAGATAAQPVQQLVRRPAPDAGGSEPEQAQKAPLPTPSAGPAAKGSAERGPARSSGARPASAQTGSLPQQEASQQKGKSESARR